jgi:hypothetical protein
MHDNAQLRRVVAESYERDAPNAAAEYGAEFRSDIESFITPEAVEAVTVPGSGAAVRGYGRKLSSTRNSDILVRGTFAPVCTSLCLATF